MYCARVCACVAAVLVLFGSLFQAFSSMQASLHLHRGMLHCIFRSPMMFFETTPLGRIINRFSKDIDTIDNSLPFVLRQYIINLLIVLTTVGVICFVNYYFIPIAVVLAILFYLIQKYYIPSYRQLRRLESVTRSPVFARFSETLMGPSVIRAFAVQGRFNREFQSLVDHTMSFSYAGIIASRYASGCACIRIRIKGKLFD